MSWTMTRATGSRQWQCWNTRLLWMTMGQLRGSRVASVHRMDGNNWSCFRQVRKQYNGWPTTRVWVTPWHVIRQWSWQSALTSTIWHTTMRWRRQVASNVATRYKSFRCTLLTTIGWLSGSAAIWGQWSLTTMRRRNSRNTIGRQAGYGCTDTPCTSNPCWQLVRAVAITQFFRWDWSIWVNSGKPSSQNPYNWNYQVQDQLQAGYISRGHSTTPAKRSHRPFPIHHGQNDTGHHADGSRGQLRSQPTGKAPSWRQECWVGEQGGQQRWIWEVGLGQWSKQEPWSNEVWIIDNQARELHHDADTKMTGQWGSSICTDFETICTEQ